MTTWLLGGASLVGAVLLLGWPAQRVRARRGAIITGRHAAVSGAVGPPTAWALVGHRQPSAAVVGSVRSDFDPSQRLTWWTTIDRLLIEVPPRRAVFAVAVCCGVGGALMGGPVAALAAAAYSGLAVRGTLRHRAASLAERAHRRQLDELCALAADLRAGLPPSVAMLPVSRLDRTAELARSAVRLAEQTGAPLADLVERIEADARAMDRGLAAAAAQAAGARATAWLLAGLPVGGIALGYGIGVDPLRILLYTPLGAACAVGAVILQLAGLAWAARLSRAGQTDRLGSGTTRAGGLGHGVSWAG